ncbi:MULTISPECIES: TIGR04255 family protein [Psychrobacter]|jgi:uncharacterized protein (TIGR04255 family)|uniref:TIGR04255 family protein n=1 Tax=Psychrobacter pacificensis TaxID=112002 RepID=A0A1G6YAS9_9GAMM|nr:MULTISPECIES: TIGR04255 family protein [Psychrobacter]GLR27939.1 hypothetical protein GCM10007915_01770 [Psychrobacter pacificensis]SDD87093.1 TIGR04255 family protein [Psychrobacter pacificensis]HBD03154.1 TIGR04255 family protein [Psychrobacter sp.]|tara:strand:- start:1359 stop:2150 length:792 start_codon:yes stop_codon:yes gene_type:complete
MCDYKKLSNQPLVFVLAEFRFSPILGIKEYIPKIQDALRNKLPILRNTETQEITVSPNGISLEAQANWEFISKNSHTAASVNQNRLLFMTSEYERFNGFEENCDFLLQTIIDVINPSLCLGLGLRYSDTIFNIEGKGSIEDFVQPRLYNNDDLKLSGSLLRQTNETLWRTTEGAIFIRSIYGEDKVLVWPDAENLPIAIEKSSDKPVKRLLLDIDHVWNAQEEESGPLDFNKGLILSKLSHMHKISRKAFWNVTTEQAKEAWK